MAFRIPDPEERGGEQYIYFGWEFTVKRWQNEKTHEPGASLLSFHRLHNPESPTLIYSYKNFIPGSPLGIEYAAAWLIGHWFEHYMDRCDCTGKPHSAFRYGFISGML